MSEQFKIGDRVMITGKIDAMEVDGHNQAYGYRVKIAGVFADYSAWLSLYALRYLPPVAASEGDVKLTQAQIEKIKADAVEEFKRSVTVERDMDGKAASGAAECEMMRQEMRQAERRQYEMDVAKHLYADLAQMSAKRAKELARDLANEFFGNKDGKGGKG